MFFLFYLSMESRAAPNKKDTLMELKNTLGAWQIDWYAMLHKVE